MGWKKFTYIASWVIPTKKITIYIQSLKQNDKKMPGFCIKYKEKYKKNRHCERELQDELQKKHKNSRRERSNPGHNPSSGDSFLYLKSWIASTDSSHYFGSFLR